MEIIAKYWVEWLCSIVAGILAIAYRNLLKRLREDRIEQQAIRNGMQAILRDRIIQAYNHYMREGTYPIYARENVDSMYAAYSSLGGNGMIKDLRERLKKLPTEPIKGKEDEI